MRAMGQRIRVIREMREMKQEVLAKKVGVTQPSVSQWENGQTLPSPGRRKRICEALEVQPTFLFREAIEAEQQWTLGGAA